MTIPTIPNPHRLWHGSRVDRLNGQNHGGVLLVCTLDPDHDGPYVDPKRGVTWWRERYTDRLIVRSAA